MKHTCLCGCGRELPPASRRHGDPYATSVCLKRHLGFLTLEAAREEERKHDQMAGAGKVKRERGNA